MVDERSSWVSGTELKLFEPASILPVRHFINIRNQTIRNVYVTKSVVENRKALWAVLQRVDIAHVHVLVSDEKHQTTITAQAPTSVSEDERDPFPYLLKQVTEDVLGSDDTTGDISGLVQTLCLFL